MKTKIKIFLEAFAVAFTACAIMMTQGDLSIFAMKHLIDASETGTVTGLAMVVASFIPYKNQWISYFLVGLFTAIADSFTHMEMFPYEAIATGFGSTILLITYEKVFKKKIPV